MKQELGNSAPYMPKWKHQNLAAYLVFRQPSYFCFGRLTVGAIMGAGERISVIPNAGGHCYESWKPCHILRGLPLAWPLRIRPPDIDFYDDLFRGDRAYSMPSIYPFQGCACWIAQGCCSIRKIFPRPCLQQMEFCQHCYRIRKTAPRSIDYSMKVLVQVRCDQNPKGNLSPDIQMCSYVEEVLWNETCWFNCDNGSMKPIYDKS